MRKFLILVFISAVTGFGQTTLSKADSPAANRRTAATANSGVDAVIELVNRGASEDLVIKTLQDQGTAYKLSLADVVKLQKAGVSENIIKVMKDPKAPVNMQTAPTAAATTSQLAEVKDPMPGSPGAAPVPAASKEAMAATPYPPDLEDVPATARKRRVVVAPFGYGAIRNTLQGYYQSLGLLRALGYQTGADPSQETNDVGQGIRAMIMTRLQQSNLVTVLERNSAIDQEQQLGLSSKNDPGKRTPIGHISGSDCLVTGDITIFGRDDKIKKKSGGGFLIPKWKGLGGAALGETDKKEKAVVALEFRLVDSETSEILLTAGARGESTRESKTLGLEGLGLGTGGAGAGGFQNAMNSSDFEKTILGEATIDAVDKVVKQLQEKIPQLPVKPRHIQGRVAAISEGRVYLALGSNDGVLRGDRFEIQQIKNEVVDPQTKEVISVEADKVGELVVNTVEDKAAIGNYGGQPLSTDYVQGKGYRAILMTK